MNVTYFVVLPEVDIAVVSWRRAWRAVEQPLEIQVRRVDPARPDDVPLP